MLDQKVIEQSSESETDPSNDYFRLRSLLLGKDYENIIEERVSLSDTDRVANVISEAFKKRSRRDNSLAQHMSPIIESSIDASIKENPQRITNVIFPIIGPAVRKAVASAIADMVHSLNHLLQQSLSAKNLIWRFKAWRLGVPYGQYVFLKSVHYRVEQIFFIHKNTGILLQSSSAPGVTYQDPDLVSSMLTAISDFMTDSFDQQSDTLSVIQFSDLSLLIEPGPHCVVAFAVRGAVNEEVKLSLSELVEELQGQYRPVLESFEGDITQFDDSRKILKEHLREKVISKESQKPWLALTLISFGLGLIGYLSFTFWQEQNLVDSYIKALKREPGYQLVSHQFKDHVLTIDLLRSPQSKSLAEFQQPFTDSFSQKEINIKTNDKLAAISQPEHFLPLLQQKYQINFEIDNEKGGSVLVASGTIRQDVLQQLQTDPIVTNAFGNLNTQKLSLLVPLSEQKKAELEFNQLVDDINSRFYYFEVASDTL